MCVCAPLRGVLCCPLPNQSILNFQVSGSGAKRLSAFDGQQMKLAAPMNIVQNLAEHILLNI